MCSKIRKPTHFQNLNLAYHLTLLQSIISSLNTSGALYIPWGFETIGRNAIGWA